MKDKIGYASLLAASFIYSIITVLFRFTEGTNLFLVSFVIFTTVAAIMLPVLYYKGLLKELRKLNIFVPLLGISAALNWLFIIYAVRNTLASNAVFLMFLGPVFAAIFAPFIVNERIRTKTVIAIIIGMLGGLIIIGPASLLNILSVPAGMVAGVGAGLFFGLNIVVGKRLSRDYNSFTITLFNHGIGALTVLPFLLISMPTSTSNLSLPFLIGILSIFSVNFYFFGIKRTPAQEVGIILLLEPIFATLLAVWVLGELASIYTVIGGALILLSGGIVALTD